VITRTANRVKHDRDIAAPAFENVHRKRQSLRLARLQQVVLNERGETATFGSELIMPVTPSQVANGVCTSLPAVAEGIARPSRGMSASAIDKGSNRPAGDCLSVTRPRPGTISSGVPPGASPARSSGFLVYSRTAAPSATNRSPWHGSAVSSSGKWRPLTSSWFLRSARHDGRCVRALTPPSRPGRRDASTGHPTIRRSSGLLQTEASRPAR